MTVEELIDKLKTHNLKDPVFVDIGSCYRDDIEIEDVYEVGVVIGVKDND